MVNDNVVAVVFFALLFGGPTLVWAISTIAENWRKARIAEQNAVLKKSMIDRGFSADEIVKVLTAGAAAKAKMAGKKPEPAEAE